MTDTDDEKEVFDEVCRLPAGVTDIEARYRECASKTTQEDADDFLEELAEDYAEREGCTIEEARLRERWNLGYYASTYLAWTLTVRVYRLFRTESPVFGKDFPEPHKAFWGAVAYMLANRGRRMRPEEIAEMELWTRDLPFVKRMRGKAPR